MNITRDNYEVFFLDFLEGNLKVDQIDQFLDFLNQNPDLKEELQLFESLNLPKEQVVFNGKHQLYKDGSDHRNGEDNRIIAYLEDDLSSDERLLFENHLADDPDLKKEYKLFLQTRLIPDHSIHFTNKNKIYKKSGSKVILTWMVSVAAMFFLAWGINSIFQSESKLIPVNKTQPMADNSPKQMPEVKKIEPLEKSIAAESHESVKIPRKVMPAPVPVVHNIVPTAQEAIIAEKSDSTEHETEILNEIAPKQAPLDVNPEGNQLAVLSPEPKEKTQTEPKVVTLDEFLVNKARKVSAEGLLSAQKIARAGLDAATEISGERLGFVEKNGKIEKIRFESRLLAFSIPLKKK
jgi:hypothetical protein